VRHTLDPAGGTYNSPPDFLAGFKGVFFYGRGRGGEKGIGRGNKGKEREERETNGGTEREKSEVEVGEVRSVPHHF